MKESCEKNILYATVYASLIVQILTGILDIYVLFLPSTNGHLAILKKLLGIEVAVQIVEGTFYGWFVSSFAHVENVTPSRYYDWAITTPSMLITFCIYLDFLNHRSDAYAPEKRKSTNDSPTVVNVLKKNSATLIPILLLNWMMLYFGYLGETNVLPTLLAVVLGFIPFILYFIMIYQHYAKYSTTGQVLFWTFSVIWALYGIAALMPYYTKNISYNILDLFAKNFFGLFLAYVVYNEYRLTI